MNMSPYALVIALSRAFEALLSSACILNLMQFSVQPLFVNYALSHCILLLRHCLPLVLVVGKHVEIVHTQYLIPFKLDCKFLNDCSTYVTH